MSEPLPHLLVVDDDRGIRETLSAALEGTYVVHCAATGDAACTILRKQPIAAIVLDVILGPENGIVLIDRFRTLSQAPILILTGYGSETVAVHALRAKASDYLKKPVNLVELRAAIERLVNRGQPLIEAVSRARRLMDERPDRPHTTASLAKEIGLSVRHLRRRFHETYGKTPRQYLSELRLQRAVELLRTTDRGIEQIALAAGFQNLAVFDRIFKRAFGVTPSDWHANPDNPSRPPTDA